MCCKNISHIEALKGFDLGNGVCRFLDIETNSCKIYESRPEICNIDSMYKRHFHALYTYKEFVNLNIEACNAMQEKFGIDVGFRILAKE